MNATVRNSVRAALPPARILDCTPEEYHRDPCDEKTPSLSASTAHLMVSESPAHAWCRHPKFSASAADESLIPEDEESIAKDNGSLVHALILGKGAEVVVIDADNFRTKLAREQRDEAKASGKLPVLASRYDELQTIVAHLRYRCEQLGYQFNGESEVPIQWYEHGAAGPVLCRSLIDHMYPGQAAALDVKTIRSANPKQIARYFVDHGYDIQDRAYQRAIAALEPRSAGRIDFTFLFMEIEPPYAVVPVIPDMALREVGKQRWGRALSLWESCLAKNVWPSYTDSLITLEAPEWVIRQELGSEWAK